MVEFPKSRLVLAMLVGHIALAGCTNGSSQPSYDVSKVYVYSNISFGPKDSIVYYELGAEKGLRLLESVKIRSRPAGAAERPPASHSIMEFNVLDSDGHLRDVFLLETESSSLNQTERGHIEHLLGMASEGKWVDFEEVRRLCEEWDQHSDVSHELRFYKR